MMDLSRQHAPLPHLEQGERVVWAGRPDPSALALRWLPVSFCGLMLTGLILFTPMRELLLPGRPGYFARPSLQTLLLSVLPIGTFAVSLALLLLPLLVCTLSRLTVYGVTDRRLLMTRVGPAPKVVKEARYGAIAAAMLSTRRNGVGDIQLFTKNGCAQRPGTGLVLESMTAVADAPAVHAMILEQMRRSSEAARGGTVQGHLEVLAQGQRSGDLGT